MKKTLLYLCAIAFFTTSCNDWLDVQPKNQSSADELFDSYSGFCDALNGCYILLKHRDLYGEKLTMSDIECMGQLWRIASETSTYAELAGFNYEATAVQTEISNIYSKMYNVVAQANMVLSNIQEKGDIITDESTRAVLEGEAYAIRAFCHFDILRMFGQLPLGGSQQVSLPYSEEVSIRVLPPYYGYEQFKEKLEYDLNMAESLLKECDPIFRFTFKELNVMPSSRDREIDDDFLCYRQNRFNYWAVKALRARYCLYTGKTDEAYRIAKEIITATGADGEALISLSGNTDIPDKYFACPSECLMMLNAYSIMDYTPSLLGAGASQIRNEHLVVEESKFGDLFKNQGANNNRLKQVWTNSIPDPSAKKHGVLRKYYYDTGVTVASYLNLTKRQVIPLLRLSEIYLIVMETTSDLNEANTLYKTYMESHNVQVDSEVGVTSAFSSLEAVREWILDEYHREFYGEGQMFYTYKRHGATTMINRKETVNESDYIVPLPNTEYDPNK